MTVAMRIMCSSTIYQAVSYVQIREVKNAFEYESDGDSHDNIALWYLVKPKILQSQWHVIKTIQESGSKCQHAIKIQFQWIYFWNNRSGDVTKDEMCCSFGDLLLSGYVRVLRRKIYLENAKHVNNYVICNTRSRFRLIM